MLIKKIPFALIGLAVLTVGTAQAETVKETVIVTQPATKSVVVTPSSTTTSNGVIVTQPETKSVVVTPATPATVTKEVTVTNPDDNTTTTTTTKQTTVAPVVAPAQQQVIVTPVPQAKEVVVTPAGFANCFTVASGWFGNEWIPQHKICQYNNAPEGVAWVEGYWACTEYKSSEGIYTNWDWRAGRWTKTLTVY